MTTQLSEPAYATLPSARLATLAAGGDAEALLHIGRRYLIGDRAPHDAGAAYSALRMAADRGHAQAMHQLARLYESGSGVAASETMASMWHRRAAKAGQVDSMVELARRLASGRGVAASRSQARAWLETAAALGSPEAAHLLAAPAVEAPRMALAAGIGVLLVLPVLAWMLR